MINVLFICAGNICRSPMAEAVFSDLVAREGLSDRFSIGSAGTDAYYAGAAAHPGTRRLLAAAGIECHTISRRVTQADLAQADYVIAMDGHNLSDLQRMGRNRWPDGRLHLLLDFAGNVPATGIPDPYYTGDYEEVYRLVEAGCRGLLAHIRREYGI